ncbi:MAG: CBS domain-containing protein [Elusimicrobia bacterium]|nr:CBS domain-containing protein [Elusimicrobiota bacterium]
MDKRKFTISPDAPLLDAVAVIEENGHRSLIVVSDEGTVVGTLSDGDVRKTLLEGRLSRVPVRDVMNTNFISLRPDESGRAKGIFESTHIFLIPVVDERLRLLDVIPAY